MAIAAQKIMMTDTSKLMRFGVKGSKASQWLVDQGIALPEVPNSWHFAQNGTLVLRLGVSEFVVEDNTGSIVAKLKAATRARVSGVYPVARADASFLLTGELLGELFSEICMLDLRQDPYANALYLTQIAGISAILIKQSTDTKTSYRIWCDGTYHRYMYETLTLIAKEVGLLDMAHI